MNRWRKISLTKSLKLRKSHRSSDVDITLMLVNQPQLFDVTNRKRFFIKSFLDKTRASAYNPQVRNIFLLIKNIIKVLRVKKSLRGYH